MNASMIEDHAYDEKVYLQHGMINNVLLIYIINELLIYY